MRNRNSVEKENWGIMRVWVNGLKELWETIERIRSTGLKLLSSWVIKKKWIRSIICRVWKAISWSLIVAGREEDSYDAITRF